MRYLLSNWAAVLNLLSQHIQITVIALLLSLLIALPLGWAAYRWKTVGAWVLGILGILYTIPSIALIILLIPFFGLNARAVIVALVIYCQVILVRNVVAGLASVPAAVLEAARGMGLSPRQVAWKVQFPLALPVILAGLRVAAVVAVAIATIGAKFGAGGLGVLLFDGIAQAGRMDKIWIGTLAVAALAFAFNQGISLIEHKVSYPR